MAKKLDSAEALSKQLSDLYVGLEDFGEENSAESLLKVLSSIQSLRIAIDAFDEFAFVELRRNDVSWSQLASSLGVSHEEVRRRFQLAGNESESMGKGVADSLSVAVSRDDAALVRSNVYTRNELRHIFGIQDASLNNGVFPFKERGEVWIFVTENKQADREQYVDKLTGDVLHWQGQKMGRTDVLIIDHMRKGEKILLFYRTAKYQFEGAGFRYEGHFEYLSHSGGQPTNFVLERAASPES